MKKKSFKFLISCWLTCAMTSSAFASVTIIGTRVIYPASEKEVTVRLDNRGDHPALVQAWIDNGNPDEAVDKINVPFVLLPPVFRMEANKGQTLRIVFTGANLPTDKESIFWLNVLDIPPRDKSLSNQNQLQMAIRSRIKIFYRPVQFDTAQANKAASGLVWRHGQKPNFLSATNNSPFYVNVSQINAEDNAGHKLVSEKGEMLAPGETKEFSLKGMSTSQIKTTFNYQYLDDFGAARKVESKINE
ncbi:molecular chaperone [Pantoea vagans]|uniref:fimbrial biogenesis chaperone n=1 Tax=Pantoea vagans TaxID=470934 RepID=UPI00224F4892|nr:molecular chaperone [Pantoea vagans]MCX3308705.1 molecular chaperone [Pantoea vagans]